MELAIARSLTQEIPLTEAQKMDIKKHFPTVAALWNRVTGNHTPRRTLKDRIDELQGILTKFVSRRRAIRISQIVLAKDPHFDLQSSKYEVMRVYLSLALQEFNEIFETLARDGGLAIALRWQQAIEQGKLIFTPAYLQALNLPGLDG